jgi:hypothetical protein
MAQLDQQGAAAPAEMQPVLKVARKMMEDRLKQLEGGKQ